VFGGSAHAQIKGESSKEQTKQRKTDEETRCRSSAPWRKAITLLVYFKVTSKNQVSSKQYTKQAITLLVYSKVAQL
jgi:hypothetical protein